MRIGSFIAQLRREKGWTQEELGERLRRWLGRNGTALGVVLVLCSLLAATWLGYYQYRQACPEDVRLPGTFACKDIVYHDRFTWIYFTFDRDGRYYVFDAYGEPIETGGYTVDGDAVALDNGEAVRWIIIKGAQLHDVAPWGGELLTYDHMGDVPMFVNCSPEDFEK